MNIIEKSRELTKVEEYLMTLDKSAKSIKDLEDNSKIEVSAYLLYNDINSREEEVEILSILTPDNNVYSTQSNTFKKSFLAMFSMMEGQPFTIIKVSGTTKAGRPYVDAVLDKDSVL